MLQSQQKSSAFLVCWNVLEASRANSVDPDQTADLGQPWFASILEFVGNVRQLFAADHLSRHFQMHFFLAL